MSAREQEYSALEQGENNNVAAPKSYRNRIVSVVSVALVMTGGAFLVANSRGSVTSTSVTNLAKESTAPQQAKLPMKVDMDRVEVPKVATSTDSKKSEAPKEEKKGADEKKEVDGGKPVSKKTAKPTVKPTTPPKPTVPPTTKKPSEKKEVDTEVRGDGPKGMTKKSAGNADKGLSPPARQLIGLANVPPPRGAESESEHPSEVDGAKAKKTSKPTVKPTAAPKPTVPPKTGKPAEKHANLATEDKHASSDSRLDGPKGMDHKSENNAKAGMAPPARSLSSQEFGGPKKSVAATPVTTTSSMKASVLDLFGGKKVKTGKPSTAPSFPPVGGKPTPIPWTGKPAEAPTKRAEEEVAPKKESTSDREEGPKGMSKSTIKKENGGFTPPRNLEDRREAAPAPKDAPAAKTAVMSPPKKAEAPKEEAPKEEKKGEAPKEEKKGADEKKDVDGAKVKKTPSPTVKPTSPPKPTVPPTTKKPSEKKGVETEARVEGPKLHPSRMLSEVRGKVNPSTSSTRGKGKTEKPVEGPRAPHDEPRGPRQLSEKTASTVSQAAKNAIYGLSGPTKSPSTGLHKPTWKPTNGTPTGKPLEQGANKNIAAKSDATSETVAVEQAKNEEEVVSKSSSAGSKSTPSSGTKKVLMHDGAPASRQLSETASVPTKSPSSGLHKPTWKPSSKPAEASAAKEEEVVVAEVVTEVATEAASTTTATKSVNTNRESGPKGATKKLAHDGAPTTRQLEQSHPGDMTTSTAGKGAFAEVGPSKSPSTGIHKPTWKPTQGKPSGKPVEPWKEGVESAHKEDKNTAHVEGELEKEHTTGRQLSGYSAGVPTKSPSSGLHKPTWKPSAKPVEHASKQGAALPRSLAAVPVTKDDADPCHDGLSPRCTPPTTKPVEHRSLAGSPTKSPSSGLHKPTWKPSSKPAEK